MSTYVYGITLASHPLRLDGQVGVGAQPRALRLLREGDLVAVVSEAPANLRAKRRDLETHASVLDSLCAGGAVVPMRFGMVAEDDATVRAQLASQAQAYAKLLSQIEGHVELNVKGFHREDALLRELLLRDQALREHSEALRAAGGSHQDKLEFGEHVAALVEHQGAEDAECVVARLRPCATLLRHGPRVVDGCFANTSFLVDAARLQDFEAALGRLRDELSAHAEVQLNGPLPPYSFVDSEPANDNA